MLSRVSANMMLGHHAFYLKIKKFFLFNGITLKKHDVNCNGNNNTANVSSSLFKQISYLLYLDCLTTSLICCSTSTVGEFYIYISSIGA